MQIIIHLKEWLNFPKAGNIKYWQDVNSDEKNWIILTAATKWVYTNNLNKTFGVIYKDKSISIQWLSNSIPK